MAGEVIPFDHETGLALVTPEMLKRILRRLDDLEEQSKPPSPVMPPWPVIDPKMLEKQ